MRICAMRTGISITVSGTDRDRLAALVKDRNAAQKHAWRAEIVLLSADGIGTNEIMRRTGKSKTCVWRWQERSWKSQATFADARPRMKRWGTKLPNGSSR